MRDSSGDSESLCPTIDARTAGCSNKRREAEAARSRFVSRDGDHATLLAAFRIYQGVRPISIIPCRFFAARAYRDQHMQQQQARCGHGQACANPKKAFFKKEKKNQIVMIAGCCARDLRSI